MKSPERLIRAQDWIYEDAGTRWQDGLILGNGNLGVIGYAPYGLEWTLNKADVFDGRVPHGRLATRAEVMKRLQREQLKTGAVLGELDAPRPGSVPPLSKTAAVLRLRFGEESGWAAARPHRVRQRLCLWEGVLYYDLDLHLSHPRLRGFTPRGCNLFCVRLERAGAALWNHTVELARPPDDDRKPPRWRALDGGLLAFEQQMPHGHARYAVALLVAPTGGPARDDLCQRCVAPRYRVNASAVGPAAHGRLHGWIPQSGNADLFVSIRTSYEDSDPIAAVVREVRQAARTGFTALERENRRWWRRFWKKSWADFGEHREIQRYWTFSLYETACLFGQAPVPGLYGLWHGPTDGPRSGLGDAHYTQDQNVQISSLPLMPLNHAEMIAPFADTYLNGLPVLRRETRRLFGRPGCRFPLCMNQLGQELTHGAYRYSLIGGPYSGLVLVWAWRYTRDRRLLKEKIYPLLREIVRFHTAGMQLGPDGRYHLDWEIPPEIYTLSRDCTATLALLKPCLEVVVEASRRFRCDETERRRWEDVLARFPDFPKRVGGDWWAGADVPPDHYTQAAYLLYPFFPGECGDERTAACTLATGPNHDIEISYADAPGRRHYRSSWAWFFPTVTAIRLGRRVDGWAALRDGLRLFRKPNGLFSHNPIIEMDPRATEENLRKIPRGKLRHADGSHSPLTEFWHQDHGPAATLNPNARRWVTPASEGSATFLLAATETLLQSHGGVIRLFPCVPKNFTGHFHHLLAQGGFEVSAEMRRGKLVRGEICARVGGKVKVSLPGHPYATTISLRRGRCWRCGGEK